MTTDGRTIRAFISSTFRDMHAERDYLARFVFPELRSRCQKRGADFIGFDLRWGVTEEEAQEEGALSVCLREIERCRPFFVCLVGDRFGWVPPPVAIPVEIFDQVRASAPEARNWYRLDDTAEQPVYGLRRDHCMPANAAEKIARLCEGAGLLLAGESITAREIRRGVFEQGYPRTHSFFYLRKPGVERAQGVPAAFAPVFSETDSERRRRLEVLKKDIDTAARAGEVTAREYEVVCAGLAIDPALLPASLSAAEREALADGVIDATDWLSLSGPVRRAVEDSGTIALQRDGLEALGRQVLEDLWHAIEAELAAPLVVLDDHRVERGYHERFVADRTRLFLGRDDLIQRMVEHLERSDDRVPLVVTGRPGGGKSALMAACVAHYRALSPGTLVVPFFVGASPGSTALLQVLRSLCQTLHRECGLTDAVPEEPDKLRHALSDFLAKAGATRRVVLVLDALNQLDPTDHSHELAWLPYEMPGGVKIILSVLPGEVLDRLQRRVGDAHVLDVPELRETDQRRLVEAYLKERRKRLTEDHLTRLLDKQARPESGLPLYLVVAAEELCLSGAREAVTARIEHLPATVVELFDQVLVRLEHDHGEWLTSSIARWLAVSRRGLLEAEVLDLLGPDSPLAHWTAFYRALEFGLRPMEEERGRDSAATARLDFYHEQLRIAVHRRYLGMETPEAPATDALLDTHRELAEYFRAIAIEKDGEFRRWRLDHPRGLSELPYHQMAQKDWAGLEATLTDIEFLGAKTRLGMGFELLHDYVAAQEARSELDQRFSDIVREFHDFVRKRLHVLIAHPDETFQEAANMPARTAPREAARRAWMVGAVSRPWFDWISQPQRENLASRTLIGHNGMVLCCDFSPDGAQILSTDETATKVHSLVTGFYQGWDLHPAQLPTRFATVYGFFLEGLGAASERLRNFVQKAAQATLLGGVFDDAATGQGLLNYFLRAMNCGAITEDEAVTESGLTVEELRGRSFAKILANRQWT